MSAKFEKNLLRTVGGVDYTNSKPSNAKIAFNDIVQKTVILFKINSLAIKNPHAHLHSVHNINERFQKRSIENCRRS